MHVYYGHILYLPVEKKDTRTWNKVDFSAHSRTQTHTHTHMSPSPSHDHIHVFLSVWILSRDLLCFFSRNPARQAESSLYTWKGEASSRLSSLVDKVSHVIQAAQNSNMGRIHSEQRAARSKKTSVVKEQSTDIKNPKTGGIAFISPLTVS